VVAEEEEEEEGDGDDVSTKHRSGILCTRRYISLIFYTDKSDYSAESVST
jgi:hypothetical protein